MSSRTWPRPVAAWAIATLAFLASAAPPASAGPVEDLFPTGEAELDLNASRLPALFLGVPDNVLNGSKANDVGQATFMTQRGWVSGWNFKDIRLAWDRSSDVLGVAINFFNQGDLIDLGSSGSFTLVNSSIAGDVDGDGDPNRTDPETAIRGGIDAARFGRDESITVGFFFDNDAIPDLLAGIPANKPAGADGISSFTVASYAAPPGGGQRGIERSYGATLTRYRGQLAHEPSQAQPDFEFTINNFSELAAPTRRINPTTGLAEYVFTIRAYSGSTFDTVSGEDLYEGQIVLQEVPEPAAVAMWGAACAVALAWRRSRRHRAA